MERSVFSGLWRIGPNAVLTLTALIATFVEAYVFSQRQEYRIAGAFQLLLYSSLLWFWLSVVWFLWLIVKGVRMLPWKPLPKYLTHFTVGSAIYGFLVLYAFSWIVFSQIMAFPDAHWFQFLRSGYEVIWLEVQRSSSRTLMLLSGICAVTFVGMPFFYRYALTKKWPDQDRKQYRAGLIAWLAAGIITIGSFLAISTSSGKALRTTKITWFSNSVNPAITMAASLFAPYQYEAVKPNLDTRGLERRLSDAKLYSDAATSTSRKSVLYIAVESLRGDILFSEHQGKEITPNINALARRSALFTSAYAQSTHTDYSIPSYLSGQYPLRAQTHFYYDRQQTWPKALIYEHLYQYGYRTAVISADTTNWGELRSYLWSEDLDVFYDAENLPTTYSATTHNRGYVTDFKNTHRTQTKAVPDREVVNFDIAWIKDAIAADAPWFLYTFFYQPHYPYKIAANAPRPFEPSEQDFESTFVWFPPDKVDVMRNAYANAVHEMDAQFGRLVQYLEDSGQMDTTVIVLTGDHGEAFAEHGEVTHAGPLFNEVAHVPLIIYAPGLEPQSYGFPAQHIDAAPTVCGLLDIPAHPGFQGIDLLNSDQHLLANRDIFLHAEPPSSWRGDAIVRGGRWKFWHDRYSDRYLLFDLLNDPGEYDDVKLLHPELAAELKAELQAWRNAQLSYYTFPQYYDNYYPPDR